MYYVYEKHVHSFTCNIAYNVEDAPKIVERHTNFELTHREKSVPGFGAKFVICANLAGCSAENGNRNKENGEPDEPYEPEEMIQ